MKILLAALYLALPTYGAAIHSRSAVNKTTCHGVDYDYEELAGYGYIVPDAVDKFGDTLGGLGSSIHLDQAAWKKLDNGSYTGVLWSLPDRGWNGRGTLNYNPRVHKFSIHFTPDPAATVDNPSPPNLFFQYQDTILFLGPDGAPCTGIDADASGYLSVAGFPDMPVSTYTGDGFGGDGPGGKRITIDAEGLYVNEDSSFWVSDEFGPYVYLFGADGKMLSAIRPPDAILPMRNGDISFSSDDPPIYVNNGEGDDVDPIEPESGRINNHGFEGLSVSDAGKSLWALLQIAGAQEGGLSAKTGRNARLLKYDVSNRLAPVFAGEWVVPLPLYTDPETGSSVAAAMTEIIALDNSQFLILALSPGMGRSENNTLSVYRHADVFDITKATDIKGDYDCTTCSIADATSGELKQGITPATYCSFLDFNVNAQLNRFGLHNGGAPDRSLLNYKWESLGMVPVDPDKPTGEFYLFSLSDNDFITQNGYMNGGKLPYADSSGYDLDSQALIFKMSISS